MFKFLVKLFFIILLIIPVAAITIVSMGLEDRPLYVEKTRITDREIAQARDFIKNNNPMYFKQGEYKNILLPEKQIDLLSRYLSTRLPGSPQTKLKLFNNAAFIIASIKLPPNPADILGQYLNITAQIIQSGNSIKVKSLEIGRLNIPDAISNLLISKLHNALIRRVPEYRAAIQSISRFKLGNKRLDIAFTWNKNIASQIKNKMANSVFSASMLDRMNAYTLHLSRLIPDISANQPSITKLLQPMFKYALERSQNNNPLLENRALFIVLGAYMLNKNIPEFMGKPDAAPLIYRDFYLSGRDDLSKHFLVSAALTAIADPSVAHAIGLEKEIKDSNGSSGFSFADLAADRAGVTIANTALSSENYARMVQQRLAQSSTENDFMPDIQHLPEGLQHINFRRIYRDTNSASYKKVIGIIDLRIARCGIYGH